MEQTKSLFIIFLLLIFIALVLGAGVAFMSLKYAAIVTGVALIFSCLFILVLFIDDFRTATTDGTPS